MVRKFVSVPPSQRLMTKYVPERAASSLDDLLRLALGADEEDVAAAADGLDDEVVRALEEARRLVEVDDVDAVARAVDERAHLRVPALGLVAEVDARVEQRAEGEREVAAKLGKALGVVSVVWVMVRVLSVGPPLSVPRQQGRICNGGSAPGRRFARESVWVGGDGPIGARRGYGGPEGTRGPRKSKL